jgi:hypothetical protein
VVQEQSDQKGVPRSPEEGLGQASIFEHRYLGELATNGVLVAGLAGLLNSMHYSSRKYVPTLVDFVQTT